jgi:hypothetical protein
MKKSSNPLIRHGDMGPCMSEPKTREEILPEIGSRLTKLEQRIDTIADSFKDEFMENLELRNAAYNLRMKAMKVEHPSQT